MKIYKVAKANGKMEINGSGCDKKWERAHVLSDFCSPWHSDLTPDVSFKALYDTENFYFCFQVEDSDIYTDISGNSFTEIGNSDRIELFFRKDHRLTPYYCLEIDASARIMNFRAYPDKEFDTDWCWRSDQLQVHSSQNDEGFVVEGSIRIACLVDLDLLKDNIAEVGVFRAKFKKIENQRRAPRWISWVRPESSTPNFHIPSSFGKFYFEN